MHLRVLHSHKIGGEVGEGVNEMNIPRYFTFYTSTSYLKIVTVKGLSLLHGQPPKFKVIGKMNMIQNIQLERKERRGFHIRGFQLWEECAVAQSWGIEKNAARKLKENIANSAVLKKLDRSSTGNFLNFLPVSILYWLRTLYPLSHNLHRAVANN